MSRCPRQRKYKFKFARWFQSWFCTHLTHVAVAVTRPVAAQWAVLQADVDVELVLKLHLADAVAEQLFLPKLADVVAEL